MVLGQVGQIQELIIVVKVGLQMYQQLILAIHLLKLVIVLKTKQEQEQFIMYGLTVVKQLKQRKQGLKQLQKQNHKAQQERKTI